MAPLTSLQQQALDISVILIQKVDQSQKRYKMGSRDHGDGLKIRDNFWRTIKMFHVKHLTLGQKGCR
jgi:hypothetical protein